MTKDLGKIAARYQQGGSVELPGPPADPIQDTATVVVTDAECVTDPATATPQQSVSRTPQPPARTATRPARTVKQRRATTTRPTNHTLLPIGTLVTALIGDRAVQGVVEPYEHYSAHQTTFPVRLVRHHVFPLMHLSPLMTLADVTVLPDREQPPDRKPPRWTGLAP